MTEDVVGLRFVTENADAATKDVQRYSRALNRLRKVLQETAKAPALERHIRTDSRALTGLQQAADRATSSTRKLQTTNRELVTAIVHTKNVTGALRQQFLATANSIAILDGPLGGVASRFSAFGILIGRTGLLLGSLAVTFTAFATVVARGTAALVRFEAQGRKIDAILQTTHGQVGKTREEIEQLAAQIALTTLESEDGMRKAAIQLLTFAKVSGETFDRALRAATDLAAAGFGTVESAAVQLAKAMQDPRQSLTSLSRAGITFTRQQRSLIISLVDTGRQAEAMSRILDNVNAQVGGASTAAASGTLAGQFDTIAQAASTLARDIARATLEITGLAALIDAAAESAAAFLESNPSSRDREIRRVEDQIERMTQLIEHLQSMLAQRTDTFFGRLFGGQPGSLRRANVELERLIQLRERLLKEQQHDLAQARSAPFFAQTAQRQTSLVDVRTEIQTIRERIGLTQDEIRLRKTLADAGMLIRPEDILPALDAFERGLRRAGLAVEDIRIAVTEEAFQLHEAAAAADALRDALEQSRQFKLLKQSSDVLEEQNLRLAVQMRLLREGVSLKDSEKRAQGDILRASAEQVLANENSTKAVREQAKALLAALDANRDLTRQYEAAHEAAERTASATDNIRQNIQDAAKAARDFMKALDAEAIGVRQQERILSLLQKDKTSGASIEALRGTRSVLEAGLAAEARGREIGLEGPELAAATARAISLARRKADSDRALNALLNPPKTGAGDSDVRTLRDVTSEIRQQLEYREQLLFATDKHRRLLEMEQRILKALGDTGKSVDRAALERAAQELSLLQEKIDRLQEIEDLNRRVGETLADTFEDIVTGASNARDAIRSLILTLSSLALQAFARPVFAGLSSALGLGNLLALNAQGNAFQQGRIVPFASGGVVSRPTLFPMRGSSVGVMGEAGPEAILPLKRTSGGKLGVHAQTSAPVVNITINARDAESFRQSRAQIAADIARAVSIGRRGL